MVVLIIQFDISAFSPNILLVELFFGSLGVLLGIKNNEGGTCSLAIKFLDEHALIGNTTMPSKELDYVSHLDLVGQATHHQGPLLVVGSNVLGQFDRLSIVKSTTSRSVESEVIAVGNDGDLNVSLTDVVTIELLGSNLCCLLILKQD